MFFLYICVVNIISLRLEIVEFEHVIKITNNILIYGKDKSFFYILSHFYLLKSKIMIY